MQHSYSQSKAMWAITRASLRSIFRSPSAVIFSFVFPLIFILVFGFMSSGSRINLKVVFTKDSDTSNLVYQTLSGLQGVTILQKEEKQWKDDLEKGRIVAALGIEKSSDTLHPYRIRLITSQAVNQQNIQVLQSILDGVIKNLNDRRFPNRPSYASIDPKRVILPGRTYRTIDFILPGQLGFSLLSAGVFGVAFLFYNLRQTLVLKRFFATPIRRSHIILGEAFSRVIFQMITAVVILIVGYIAFDFTLVNGVVTFMELLALSFMGLLVFMGFGFVVSGLARNESTIPPFANLITLPQFLLSGTFFPTDNFPSWLQPVCKALPLTHLNEAMRSIAFEGKHFSDCLSQLGVLAGWGILVYALAVRVFRWE